MTSMKVDLSQVEAFLASQVGSFRNTKSLAQGNPDAFGLSADKDGWGLHIEGAAGEMAAAKALNIYWSATVNTFKKGGDLGDRIQVRTRSKHDYELLVHPSDRDDDVFVLVTGKSPHFLVHGWISGRDAKQTAYLKTHGGRDPAYFVPHRALHKLDELKAQKDFHETRL